MSFGPYLKDLRQRKGISMEAVASEIKISLTQLAQIEAEDHQRLPDDVFVRGILKSYARFIGVDENDIIDRYMICRGAFGTAPRLFAKESSKKKFRPRVSVPLQILLILIVIPVLYVIYGASLRPSPPMSMERVGDFRLLRQSDHVSPTRAEIADFRLELNAREQTRVEISPDDRETMALLLFPMDHIELAVSRRVRLKIENAGGLHVRFNDQTVAVPGKSGQAVILDLP